MLSSYIDEGDPNRQQSARMNSLDPGDATSDAGLQNRSSWGGRVGGADRDVNRYRSMGEAAANRSAYHADYGAYDADRANAGGARQQQMDALSLQQSAALGQQPSRAEVLGKKMIGQSLDAELAASAGARGGSLAQAAAYRNAANQAGAFRQQGMTDIEALRADEMARARDAYAAGAGAVRAGDYQGAGLALGKSAQEIQAEEEQRKLNQQGQEFYEGQAHDTQSTQLQANLQAQNEADQRQSGNIQAGAHSSDFGFQKVAMVGGVAASGGGSVLGAALAGGGPMDAPRSLEESNRVAAAETRARLGPDGDQYDPSLGSMGDRAQAAHDHKSGFGSAMRRFLSGAAGGASMGTSSPMGVAAAPIVRPRAHGGPMQPHPYLVGEQGPELVLPRNDGYVLTAQQTAALLGAPPTKQQTEYLESRGLGHAVAARAMGGPVGGPFGRGFAAVDPLQGASAGELGMGGAGGLVGGTIGHENRDVQGAFKPLSGFNYAREEGGPVEGEAQNTRFVVYRAPDAPSAAPAGSGPKTVPTKVARVPAHDPSVPWSFAPVHGGTAMASTSKPSARAMGGPVSGLGRAAAMRRCA